MRLICLTSSKSTFKDVRFNQAGASFILAEQTEPEVSDTSKTYNGVGKSLLVALIDYCLGASTSSKITKSLQTKLPDWDFSLAIEINGERFAITRFTNTPKEIIFNNETKSLDQFRSIMAEKCFSIPKHVQFLSFRSLLSFFLRPSKTSYGTYDRPIKQATDYQIQLYNAFLLGLNVELAQKKMKIKQDMGDNRNTYRAVQNDPILKQIFDGNQETTLAIADLSEKIDKLNNDLQTFEIADDYYDIKSEADETKKSLDQLQNQIKLKEINLENIENSLIIKPDIARKDLQKIYDESQVIFTSNTVQLFTELEEFHTELIKNRTARLLQQQQDIYTERDSLQSQFSQLKTKFDNLMKFLNTHQAIEVYTQMSRRVAECEHHREKLLEYQRIKGEFEQQINNLKANMIEQISETTKYLEHIKDDIKKIMEYFRKLAKKFYPNAASGITIELNGSENSKINYDLAAKIESDASDGINSVKQFCYDLTLLMAGSNHNIDFVFHDSRLFHAIDETHCNELFNIINNMFTTKQYIASINQNLLHNLNDEMKMFIDNKTILKLTDNSDSGKLLGITVELEYD